jgi:membrane-associated phospholipid phosphatase
MRGLRCAAGVLVVLFWSAPGFAQGQRASAIWNPSLFSPTDPAWFQAALVPPAFDDAPRGVAAQEQGEEHPTPRHTGFGALARTLGADFKAFPSRPSTWVLLGIGAAAALLAHPIDDDVNSHLVGSKTVGRFWAPGKWVGAAPTEAAASIGLYVVGRYVVPRAEGAPKTNKLSHLGYDLLRAQIVSQALVQSMKFAVRRERPNGESWGFPSGHAATAFASASVLERHLGYRAAWPTLAIATYVATSRLHDNVHFLSDVLFGSAIGMASGWTVVGRHGRNEYALVPVPTSGGIAIMLTRVGNDAASTNGRSPRKPR